jgi:Nif-specific regulatory protein
VSQTITSQVLREGIALLSNDLFESEGLGERPSLIAARVCSVLCVPLVVFESALGVVYLDTSDPASRFDEGHLQLLTAIAGVAAVAFENARHFESLEGENQRLQKEVHIEHQMVGESAAMRNVYQFIGKVAPTNSKVLIRGESGTGKELTAHAIHLNSPRARKPFLAINCATLVENLVESELFGHERGAFTGAITQKLGKLEIADGGTLFLDEVGELTAPIQVKLLRVLENGEFERLGGKRSIKVDVRIIAATNRDLEEAIKAGGFREDLYYRLNVVSVVMPSLMVRREDILLLARFFLDKYSKECKRRVTGISAEALALLKAYDWPGNVRELENVIERAIVLGETDSIGPEDLPEALLESFSAGDSSPLNYYEAIKEAKKQLIIKALKQAEGNYTKAAGLLGVHPNNLHRLIRSLNIKAELKIDT